MRILLATIAAAAALACATATPAPDPQLVSWQTRHPVAARDLCAFARNYPWESSRVRRWMHDHPTQAAQLMDWAAANPGAPPPQFFSHETPDIDGYRPWRDPALNSLLDWASQNPEAAEDLASTHRGVEGAIDNRNC